MGPLSNPGPHPSMIGSYCHLLAVQRPQDTFHNFCLPTGVSRVYHRSSAVSSPSNISDILLFYPFSRSWTVCQDPAKTQHDTSSPTQLLSTSCLALSSRCLEILSWTVASCPDAVTRQSWLLPFEFLIFICPPSFDQ